MKLDIKLNISKRKLFRLLKTQTDVEVDAVKVYLSVQGTESVGVGMNQKLRMRVVERERGGAGDTENVSEKVFCISNPNSTMLECYAFSRSRKKKNSNPNVCCLHFLIVHNILRIM